jgi:mono/diheme cytochrome c family protein
VTRVASKQNAVIGFIHFWHEHIMKKHIFCGSAAILMTGLTVSVFTTAEPRPERDTQARVAQQPKKNLAAIERGRYLVKIAGCNDCHTPGYAQAGGTLPEKQWLLGDTVGYQGPWGTTYPVNLRLLMQSMSEQQWLAIARNPARPPMPWFALRDMTDADLSALYHYVRDLGPAGEAAPAFVEPGKPVKTPVLRFPD